MLRHHSIPLLFLFVGSLLGVFLRWQFISPTSGINYSFYLHGHSHTMFLGWIFNALYIGFVNNHISTERQTFFIRLFYMLQLLVVAMMISFPLQGYGVFSITFSTLHTLSAAFFAFQFFRQTCFDQGASAWYARMALIMFIISSIGPFSLGYLTSNGMGHSNWYYFAIYFYLHFQYNGFFFFGILSLALNYLERKNIRFADADAKKLGSALAVACITGYFLSILWAKPHYSLNIIGGAAAVAQLCCLYFIFRFVCHRFAVLKGVLGKSSIMLLSVAFIALTIKFILQLASAFPPVAQMAYELRPVVIAYLHLVLVGVVSLILLVWYRETNLLDDKLASWSLIIFVVSFAGMECCMTLMPWWTKVFGREVFGSLQSTFAFSVLLSMSCLMLFISSLIKPDKSQLFN